MINVFQPSLGAAEAEAVAAVFASNWLGVGPKTKAFTEAFAKHLGVGAEHLVPTTCCSEGLFQVIAASGAGPGTEVVMPTVSFVAAGNAVLAVGARPVFCDVDRRTLNVTVEQLAAVLTERTKAIVLMHFGGLPADIAAIAELARSRGIVLIEDSACSVASRVDGRACGVFGDYGLWSFDAMKILVTIEGGMVYAKDPAAAQRLREMMYLGLTTTSGFSSKRMDRWWAFDVSCPGRRAIFNDVNAVVGLVQLERLRSFIDRRRAVHAQYVARLRNESWLALPPEPRPGEELSHYFFWVQLHERPELRDALATFLREKGIYTTFRYYPLHLVRAYGAQGQSFPEAEWAAEATLCLPMHQGLSDQDVDTICDAVCLFGRQRL